jgi:hypothetical protein
VEYVLDTEAKTATLAWVSHATEVTPNGAVAWEADVAIDGRPALVPAAAGAFGVPVSKSLSAVTTSLER